MKIWYINDAGKCVEGDAVLEIDGVPFDESLMRRSPFYKTIAAAEWDLIKRYDRGELT